MNEKDNNFEFLLQKYIANECSEEELAEFFELIRKEEFDGAHLDALKKQWGDRLSEPADEAVDWGLLLEEIHKRQSAPASVSSYLWVAAIILMLLGVTAFFNYFNHPEPTAPVFLSDAYPATNGATLMLENGTSIRLRDDQEEIVTTSEGIRYGDGQMAIESNSDDTSVYGILTTPRGGFYRTILPDGSKVWLNAHSTLRYPLVFGKERSVSLRGEAYFEIAKDSDKPFIVQSAHQATRVLGTSFNISDYEEDQSVTTSLLTGSISVKLSLGQEEIRLSPGQQCWQANGKSGVSSVSMDEALAWKNGFFRFNDISLTEIVKQLERWYNVQIILDVTPKKRFNGIIQRSSNLSEVMRMLELTGGVSLKYWLKPFPEKGSI